MYGGAPLTKAQAQEILALGTDSTDAQGKLTGGKNVSTADIQNSALFKNINFRKIAAWSGWNSVEKIHFFNKEQLENDIATDAAPETLQDNYYKRLSSAQVAAILRLEEPHSKKQPTIIIDFYAAKEDPVLSKMIGNIDDYVGYEKTVHRAYHIFNREVLKAVQHKEQADAPHEKAKTEQTKVLSPEDAKRILDISARAEQEGQRVVKAADLKTVLNTATIKKLDQVKGFVSRRTGEDQERIYTFDEAVLQEAAGIQTGVTTVETGFNTEKMQDKSISGGRSAQ